MANQRRPTPQALPGVPSRLRVGRYVRVDYRLRGQIAEINQMGMVLAEVMDDIEQTGDQEVFISFANLGHVALSDTPFKRHNWYGIGDEEEEEPVTITESDETLANLLIGAEVND